MVLMIARVIDPAVCLRNGTERLVYDAIMSVVGAIPFIFSFLALSVLGSEDGPVDAKPVTEIIPAEGL